ncbi:MAG: RraA family protein [Chloroflexota bacterium]
MGSAEKLSLEETCERYRRLYVPAVADVLDDKGLWHQIMDNDIKGLTLDMKVAGPAFTISGAAERSLDRAIRKGAAVIDHISALEVAVMETRGDTRVGHWGELLTNGAMRRGAGGAVIDGGLRDTSFLLALGFPVFSKFRCPGDAKGRWNVTDMQTAVTCGGVKVEPGDFIFGDGDGVVVIPRDMVVEVLIESEETVRVESEIRGRIKAGDGLAGLYQQYTRF